MEEVRIVLGYIAKLLDCEINGKRVSPKDIGIVSPYKSQCQALKRLNRHADISIGTAAIFQGQERSIMIISTVRTDDKMGFVSEEQVKPVLPETNIFNLTLHNIILHFFRG